LDTDHEGWLLVSFFFFIDFPLSLGITTFIKTEPSADVIMSAAARRRPQKIGDVGGPKIFFQRFPKKFLSMLKIF